MRTLGTALVLTLALAGPAAAKTYTLEDSGSAITVKKGATFEVQLEELGPAGYAWSDRRRPDRAVVKRTARDNQNPTCEEPPCPVGGPSTLTLTYKAVGKGRTKLNLQHQSVSGDIADRFKLTVKVR